MLASTWLGGRRAWRGRSHRARWRRAHGAGRGRHVAPRAARRRAALGQALALALGPPALLLVLIVRVVLALQVAEAGAGDGAAGGGAQAEQTV